MTTTTSSNILQRHPMHDPPRFDKVRSSTRELYRLATFGSLQEHSSLRILKGVLAKFGLFYVSGTNILKCDGCAFEYELDGSNINPLEEHERKSPACAHALKYNESVLQQVSVLESVHRTSGFDLTSVKMDVSDCDHQDEMDDPNPQKSFINSISKANLDKIRANTFSNWPLITPCATDMISAGWAFTSIGDRVICIHCGALFHNWGSCNLPYEVHRLKSPYCPFVLLTEKDSHKSSATIIKVTNDPNVHPAVKAIHNIYASAAERYATFEKWPHTEENPLPSIASFVDAGFFYTNEKTAVKCFYCNGSLQNWNKDDDPKIEHCRWYPNCAYIRQYVGEDLYQAVQRKKNEINAIRINQNSKSSPWNDDEIDKMVKARLDLPIVEKLRKKGFIVSVIRKALEIQLKHKHDDFKTENDFQMACLMLHQQAKLIKGNKNNLLVPGDWMKQYIEEQEHGTLRSTSKGSSMSQTPDKKSISPQLMPQHGARAQAMSKTNDELMLCAICLSAERQVACLPCGHLTSCVACGHSLTKCPLCRTSIQAFVRIYV